MFLCVWSSFCSVVISVISSFVTISLRKQKMMLYFNCNLTVVWLSVFLSLPSGIVGLSMVSVGPYSLVFIISVTLPLIIAIQ